MTTKEKIIATLEKIPETRLPELYELIDNFRKKARVSKKNKWADFPKILTDEEAEAMKVAIEEAFGQIEDE